MHPTLQFSHQTKVTVNEVPYDIIEMKKKIRSYVTQYRSKAQYKKMIQNNDIHTFLYELRKFWLKFYKFHRNSVNKKPVNGLLLCILCIRVDFLLDVEILGGMLIYLQLRTLQNFFQKNLVH
jgi:hypothetical protein